MSGIQVGPAYRDPDDEFEYWLSQKEAKAMKKSDNENAPDKLLKYAELIQIFENEIKWCVANPGEAANHEFNRGFLNGLTQAKYLVTKLTHLNKCKMCDNPVGNSDPLQQWCDEHHQKFCGNFYGKPGWTENIVKEAKLLVEFRALAPEGQSGRYRKEGSEQ